MNNKKKMVISGLILFIVMTALTIVTSITDTDWAPSFGAALLFYGVAYLAMGTVTWLAINYD